MTVRRGTSWRWGLVAISALALLVAVPSGCALFFKAPEVEIVEVEIVALGLRSGTAEVTLEVANRSSRGMSLEGLEYRLEVRDPREGEGWTSLAEGFHRDQLRLAGKETGRVTVPVPFQYEALGSAIRSFLASGTIPYRFSGQVRVGGRGIGLHVPFRSEGVLGP